MTLFIWWFDGIFGISIFEANMGNFRRFFPVCNNYINSDYGRLSWNGFFEGKTGRSDTQTVKYAVLRVSTTNGLYIYTLHFTIWQDFLDRIFEIWRQNWHNSDDLTGIFEVSRSFFYIIWISHRNGFRLKAARTRLI